MREINHYQGKNIAVLTAGGDTAALNNSIVSVRSAVHELGGKVYGIVDGFHGMLFNPSNALRDINFREIDGREGGTVLGTKRTGTDGSVPTQKIMQFLKQKNLDALVVMGGDGTSAVAQAIYEQDYPILVLPKTVDNDLITSSTFQYSDRKIQVNLTPGYVTGADKISLGAYNVQTTASSHGRIVVMETMGRGSGYLAAAAHHGGADMLLIPELGRLSIQQVVERIKTLYKEKKSNGDRYLLISVAEGFRMEGYAPNHHGDIGPHLKSVLQEEFHQQKIDVDCIVKPKGYDPREGNPHDYDFKLVDLMGKHIGQLLLDGIDNEGNFILNKFGRMVSLDRIVSLDHLTESHITSILIEDSIKSNELERGRLPDEFLDRRRYAGTPLLMNFLVRVLGKARGKRKVPDFPIIDAAPRD